MKIDGKAIADGILDNLRTQVNVLKGQGVRPTLVVILVGDDPASLSYIKQKQKAAEAIGARLLLNHQQITINKQQLETLIQKYNSDPSVHGIIVQRPLPGELRAEGILPAKDVDGFYPNSPFPVPVAAAVSTILERSHPGFGRVRPFQKTRIVVIGRGETAGKPVAEALIKQGYNVTIIHSQTPNPDDLIRSADIVVSCVGKFNIVRRDNIKEGVFLISVGIWRDSQGKLHGDYEEDEINIKASYFTPTPGGVGPVNVACLMANLLKAAL